MNYEIYDYEKIPDEIELKCIEHVRTVQPHVKKHWPAPGQCFFEIYSIPNCLKEWIESDSNPWKNEDFLVGIQKIYGGNRLYPHIDHFNVNGKEVLKEYGINYLLQTSNATTEWYANNDYSSVIDSYKFSARTWHKIRTDIYHGAIGIESEERIAVLMSPRLEGMKKYL